MWEIRAATPADSDSIYRIHEQAFPGDGEARLVQRLTDAGAATISLIATHEGEPLGHILFSPARMPGPRPSPALGLAPMAVLPGHQRRGVGGQLIEEGCRLARERGFHYVVVLGHPQYYPRFGFKPAAPLGLGCIWPVPPEVFMIRRLRGEEEPRPGLIHYHPILEAEDA